MAEPLNATFFAFRKRERGGVLLRTSIAFAVAALLLYAAFIALFWAQLAPIMSWYADMIGAMAANNPEAMQGMTLPAGLGVLALGGIVWIFLFFVLFAAYEAACLKWMIHGETRGLAGLNLGADTWRVYSTYWLWFVLYIGFSIIMGVVGGLLLGIFAMSAMGSGGDVSTAMLTAMPIFYILQYGLLIYFAVRFAPAAATSIARRRFSFFQAWTVTKGRFWALFGAFFLLGLIYIIWGIIYFAIWLVAVAGPSVPDLANVGADPQAMYGAYMEFMQAYIRSLLEPRTWMIIAVMQIISWAVALLFYVMAFGINARAAQAALHEGKIQPA